MNVRLLADDRNQAWNDYVAGHPGGTIYHGWVWRKIFQESFGYRPLYLAAEGPRGIVGCLPLFEVRAPWSRRLVGVPFRDRGGPLYDDESSALALIEAAIGLCQERGAHFLELKSLQPLPPSSLNERRYWVRSTTSLAALNLESLDQKLGPKTRNMVRQAIRAGLKAQTLAGPTGLNRWYALYLRSQRHLGLPPLPRTFFASLLKYLGEQVEIQAIFHQDQLASACWVFTHRESAMYAYSASDPAKRRLRPNDLMLYNLLQQSLQRNLETLDFGSDSPAQEQLLFFKRKWLAMQEPIPSYTWGKVDQAVADSSSARYQLARRVFQHLPLPLLDWLGRWLARYFG